MPKKFPAVPAVSMVLILFSFILSAREPAATINFPLNRVFVVPSGASNMKYAQFNMLIFPGDKIETKGGSRCEILLINGDIIRLDENTVYSVEKIDHGARASRVESLLSTGKLWFGTRKDTLEEQVFYLKTPSTVIAARSTVFRTDLIENSATEGIVYEGEIWVASYLPGMQLPAFPEQPGVAGKTTGNDSLENEVPAVSESRWQPVVAGQSIIVQPDGTTETNSYDTAEDEQNDWVEWNHRRNIILEQTLR